MKADFAVIPGTTIEALYVKGHKCSPRPAATRRLAGGAGGERRRESRRCSRPHIGIHSPIGGRVVIVGSKNVAAPGMGAAAYSASKAAVTQIARVAALEWAEDGIRVNTVHPDAVFDTALWSDDRLAERADRYGLTVDEYKRRNLLGVAIGAADVAALVAALCTYTFRATTGAQIPIDGSNERLI